MPSEPVPAFVNPEASGAQAALDVLRGDGRVRLYEVGPAELSETIARVVEERPSMIIVAGGDETVSTAAACVVNTPTTLAIIRSGTLNHFARRLGIPADPRAASEVAFGGTPTPVDIGWVNDHLFLNTSVLGLYVDFVHARDRLQHRIGRGAASIAAAVRSFSAVRHYNVELEIDGCRRLYKSVLLFAAIGEREFQVPRLGEFKEAGRRGLHVVAVQPGSRMRLLLMAARMAAKGVRPWPAGDQPETFITQGCRLSLARPQVRMALDGEIADLTTPLFYRFQPDAISVRTPAPPQDR